MLAEHNSPLSIIKTNVLKSLECSFGADRNQVETILKKSIFNTPDELINGHWSSNIAMVSAGVLKRSPHDVAKELIKAFADSPSFERIEIAGPGFINFYLTENSLLRQIEHHDEYLKEAINDIESRTILIEFVSANPTGPLHVGHGRGAAFGDALKRLLSFVGHDVTTEYYVNDAGRQMDIVTASILLRAAEVSDIDFPHAGYQGEYIKTIASSIIIESGARNKIEESIKNLPEDKDEAIDKICIELKKHSDIWQQTKSVGLEKILGLIKSDLSEFNVIFDEWFFESSLGSIDEDDSKLRQALDLSINEAGYEKDGAYWLRSTNHGDDKDRVLIRKDGRVTYLASDVAYHKEKLDRGFDQLINIWGADHHGYIKRIEAAIESVGHSKSSLMVLLVQFANLFEDGQKLKMSTRSGTFYDLGKLVELVGADVARFYYLSKQADQHLDFDVSLAKSESKENLYFYIQYAHARIASLEKKYEEANGSLPSKTDSGNCPDALVAIIQVLMNFPVNVLNSVERYQPHLLIYYLRDLSQAIHQFYNEINVMKAASNDASNYMFVLLKAKNIIKQTLNLLGIEAKNKM